MSAARRALLGAIDRCVTDAHLGFRVGDTTYGAGCRGRVHDVVVRVHDERVFDRTIADANLGLGESYMEGFFDLEAGTLADLLTILLRNRLDERIRAHPSLALRLLALRLRNRIRGVTANVGRHYDVGEDLFERFLDGTLTYSCGYAVCADDSLETLQRNKLERICRKLRLRPGLRLLDIGCGFGGLLAHAAREHGIVGVGVTNSRAHHDRGAANLARLGLSERVRLELNDYGAVTGEFDRVVSVGMLEHVPRRDHGRYFRFIASRLGAHGLGLVHAIGCNAPRNVHDPFTQTYVFPGSNQPKLSEIAAQLERCRLAILDVENIVRHYGYTVRHWLDRFLARQSELDPVKYDRRFRRMWEYYLSCGIAAAAASESAVYQVLFTNDYCLDLPLARV